MADVGLGERITAYGRYRSKVAKDAVRDNQPLLKLLDAEGGVDRVSGGRTYLNESLTAQNATVGYVGETGTVSLANQTVLDSPESSWTYLLGSINLSLAEKYMNEGQGRYIDVYAAKQDALEGSMMKIHHAGISQTAPAHRACRLTASRLQSRRLRRPAPMRRLTVVRPTPLGSAIRSSTRQQIGRLVRLTRATRRSSSISSST